MWRGAGMTPGQGAKTPHASGPKHSNQGKTKNRSNAVTNSIKTFKMVHIKKTYKKTPHNFILCVYNVSSTILSILL